MAPRLPQHGVTVLAFAILAVAGVPSVHAGDDAAAATTYIIHMDSSFMPTPFTEERSWYASTVASLSTAELSHKLSSEQSTVSTGSAADLLYVYTHTVQGFSARLSPSDLRVLEATPGFLSAYPDRRVKADTTHSVDFLGLTESTSPTSGGGGGGLWQASSQGEGVIIGVIDTGVWPESPSFSDTGIPDIPSRWRGACDVGEAFEDPSKLCNRKLIGARYFSRGLLAQDPNATLGFNSTRDSDGHGTHTSSTAAGNYAPGASYFGHANGTARGIAPRAHVAMYKALWPGGGYSSDVIAAFDAAVKDGVDVISLSLGIDGVPLHQDPVSIASFGAVEKGVFVATSTGNAGPSIETLHNGIPWTLTIGASTIDRQFAGVVELGRTNTSTTGITINGTSLYIGTTPAPENAPLVLLKSCTDGTELKSVSNGSVILCLNTTNFLSTTMQSIRESSPHVAGAIVVSEDPFVEFYELVAFPAVIVTHKDGDAIKECITKAAQSGTTPTVSLRFHVTLLGVQHAPAIAAYTSRGPSPSIPAVLKPDLVAPGALILAAWPTNTSVATVMSKPVFSSFNVISGSSMACPHAAGVAALLRKVYPDWSPAAIRSAMMTTADVVDNTGAEIGDIGDAGKPASPLVMGAGHINPNKALDPGLVYDAGVEDYVRLLCGMKFTEAQIKSIVRSKGGYNCSEVGSSSSISDLNYPSFIAFFDKNKTASSNTTTVQELHRTLTNVADGSFSYTAELTPIEGLEVTVKPDRLTFTSNGEKQTFVLQVKGTITAGHNSSSGADDVVLYGALYWTDQGKRHVVRSPIVATTLSRQPL